MEELLLGVGVEALKLSVAQVAALMLLFFYPSGQTLLSLSLLQLEMRVFFLLLGEEEEVELPLP